MTKPTGRPRGRPKTKEYVTLMARVSQDLADRVQRYAGLHQQPISVVLRDALEVLLEAERYQPLLSDRNRDGAAEPAQDAQAGVASQQTSDIMSDTKAERSPLAPATPQAPIMSDEKAARPPRTCTAKMSDTKAGHRDVQEGKLSDTKADDHTPDGQETLPAIMSDTKEGQSASPPEPAIMSDTNMPAFDPGKYILGKLCPRRHEHGTTGQSLLKIGNRHCPACDREKWHEKGSARRQAKRQA